ncbi:hypothetical protein TNCV_2030911 [Trichonephila clavipes]|nr:hypothetical protein TNCV_2030911 [Trichonephila clavipes]
MNSSSGATEDSPCTGAEALQSVVAQCSAFSAVRSEFKCGCFPQVLLQWQRPPPQKTTPVAIGLDFERGVNGCWAEMFKNGNVFFQRR